MKTLFELSWNGTFHIMASCLGIYIPVILLTRVFGKRSFSKMSSFDFAMTVAVGSLIATTVLSGTVSLAEGMVAVFAAYLFQLTAAYFRRYMNFQNTIDNKPLLLMAGPTILFENLKESARDRRRFARKTERGQCNGFYPYTGSCFRNHGRYFRDPFQRD